MSNVEVVLEVHAAVSRGDVDALLALAHPEIEYRSAIQLAMEGEESVFRGYAGVRQWFGELQDLYDYIESEVQEVHEFGDRVVVVHVVRGRGTGSGVTLEQPLAQLITLRDGKVLAVWDYFTREEALAAAGSSG